MDAVPSLFLLWPATAAAQAEGEPVRGARTHDGFYFRLGTGIAYTHDSVRSNLFDEASLSGLGLGGELLFGGTIAPGLVLGCGTHGTTAFKPELDKDGDTGGGPNLLVLSAIGPFGDYYFEPRGGAHVQVFLGYGVLQADASTADENPQGFAIAVAAGHEWWIGEQWSLGILGRILYAALWFQPDDDDERHSLVAPGVLGTVTYH